MAFRNYQIVEGTTVSAASSVTLLPSGLTGTLGALRCLTYPGNTFAPIIYYTNPTRTFNLNSDVLRHPIVGVSRTLDSTKVIRFEENEEDVIVSEVWENSGGVGMPDFMFKQLYEYLLNPPPFDSLAQTYIQWCPRDESDDVFNVELIGLVLGEGSPGQYSVKKFRGRGGVAEGGAIKTPTDSLDVSPTAFLDRSVTLTLRIVNKV